MSIKTYPTGEFRYSALRPPVKALAPFVGKPLDARFATDFLHGLEDLARGIAGRRVLVRWQDDAQDHSYTREDGAWVIVANPKRLLFVSAAAPGEATYSSVTSCGSVLGAVLHEAAHVLYSPETHKGGKMRRLTRDELALFRVYEDLYVNSVLVRQRAPGFAGLVPYAYNWLSPADAVVTSVNQNDASEGAFARAVLALSADFFAFINKQPDAKFPEAWQAELTARLRPLRERLASGEVIPWERRHRMLKRAVKITYGVLHKYGMYDPPPPPGTPQPQAGDGDGDGEPSEGGSQPESGDGDSDLPGDMSGLADVPVPEQAEDCGPSCGHKDTDADLPRHIARSLREAFRRANRQAEAQETGFDAGPPMDHAEVTPATSTYPTDHYDRERAAMLKRAFRTFSQTRRGWLHGAEAGKLSSRRLAALASGSSPNVFKARAKVRGTQGAVLILIDGSGSMQGRPYEQAAIAARELYEAIGRNPDYEAYVWAYSGSSSRVDIVSGRHVGGQFYWPPADGGSTPSWRAMTEGAKWLKAKHPRTKRVIIHLTDTMWNDRYIPEFTEAVERDHDLDYITIGIGGHRAGANAVRMRVSTHDVGSIVDAVQEFATKTFKG